MSTDASSVVVVLHVAEIGEAESLRERIESHGVHVMVAGSANQADELSQEHPSAVCFVERGTDIDIEFEDPPAARGAHESLGPRVRELEDALTRTRTALRNALRSSPVAPPSISGERHAAEMDPMTGLMGAGLLQDYLDREYARARRYGHALSVLVIDVDGMGRYCKRNGEAAGDAALRLIADVLRSALRTPDVVARTESDSFAILATDTSEEQALALGGRLREALAKESEHTSRPAVTISIGIASVQRFSAARALDLLHAAGRAAAEAKIAGGDRSCIAVEA